jgi:hypothetical protein
MATAPASTLTAATAAAASPGSQYPARYAAFYGAPVSGVLTAADTRTGGPR